MFRKMFSRVSEWLHRGGRKDAELREELEFHLEAEAEERAATGLSESEARNAARRELGNATLLQEETRRLWTWTTLEQLRQDLRYAARTMGANRTFTTLAVLSLALGIGANTAIYSFVESIFLRSLPVPEPQSLVVLKWRAKNFPSVVHGFTMTTGGTHPDSSGGRVGSIFPYAALGLFQANTTVLSSAFCYMGADRLNVTAGGQTEAIASQYVSGDYFRGMGVPPAAGRLIMAEDDVAGAAPVAVMSHRMARQYFGQPAGAIGQAIRVNTTSFTVIGVTPPEFFGAEPAAAPELYLPLHTNLLLESAGAAKNYLDRTYYWIDIMARLKPGVSMAQAESVLGPQFRQFALDSASNERERSDIPELKVLEGAGGLDSLRFRYSKPLYILMAMVGMILVIACANIANLLLARATARRREMAVRLSMGASRFRVIRQLLTESVLLASTGGALGVMLAYWGIRFVTLLLSTGQEGFSLRAELNWHVLGVTLGLSIVTGLLFGLAPAVQATRVDVMPSLKESQPNVHSQGKRTAFRRMGLSRILVGAQMAFSLVLLMAAGLFAQTLSKLHSIHLGFNRENVLLFTIKPRAAGYEGAALAQLYGTLRERLGRIPGVRAASFSGGAAAGRRRDEGAGGGAGRRCGYSSREPRRTVPGGSGIFRSDADSPSCGTRVRRARCRSIRSDGDRQSAVREGVRSRESGGPSAAVGRQGPARDHRGGGRRAVSESERQSRADGVSAYERGASSVAGDVRSAGGGKSAGPGGECARSGPSDGRAPGDFGNEIASRAYRPGDQPGDHTGTAVHGFCGTGVDHRVRRALRNGRL